MGAAAGAFAEGTPPLPTVGQLAWQDMELGMFICYDICSATGTPIGWWRKYKPIDPGLYNPVKLNTDQWMEAARTFGAKYAVFVAKHCSGFIQWQSDLYPYGVKQTKWRDGKGDVVKDFIQSCHKYKIRPGIYASMSANGYWEVDNPGLVNRGKGGDEARQAAYNRVCEKMCEELWSRYGELIEIWFDGGVRPPELGGPNIWPIQKRLQPKAMVHDNGAGEHGDIRWGGSERGFVGDPCWATMSRYVDHHTHNAGKDAPRIVAHGDPDGKIWMPAEADPVLRGKGNHEWFWQPNQEHTVFDLEALMKIYYESVGRNANLLLNSNPDREGLIPLVDFQRYVELGREIRRRFSKPIAETSGVGHDLELTLPRAARIDHIIAMEDIAHGERVREYVMEGLVPGNRWEKICEGTCIGHKRIQKFHPVEVAKVRLRCIKSVATPRIRKLTAYFAEV